MMIGSLTSSSYQTVCNMPNRELKKGGGNLIFHNGCAHPERKDMIPRMNTDSYSAREWQKVSQEDEQVEKDKIREAKVRGKRDDGPSLNKKLHDIFLHRDNFWIE